MEGRVDPRIHEALTDLYTFVLILDAEWHRVDQSLEVPMMDRRQRAALEQSRKQLEEEVSALRSIVVALRTQADPSGLLL